MPKTEEQKKKYNEYMKNYMAKKRRENVPTAEEQEKQRVYIRNYMQEYRSKGKKPRARLEAGDIYSLVKEIEEGKQ